MLLAADRNAPVLQPKFEFAGDHVIVLLQEALPVLWRIKVLSIMFVPRPQFEVFSTFVSGVD